MPKPDLPGQGQLVLPEPEHRLFLWIAAAGTVLQFIAFKLCYPYAGFLNGDSYAYLQSAVNNYDISTYPIGYSKFLRIFSTFTRSDTALVAFQYLAIQAGALALLFTLNTIFRPRRITVWIMFIFAVFNPVTLYISNYVSSDALFFALSLWWLTLLLTILQKPSAKLLVAHLLVLTFTFMVRYNAICYPLLSAIVILLTSLSLKKKLTVLALTIAPIALFIVHTSNQYYQAVGIRQFSPFSGWQLANNALYAYRYVDSKNVKTPPPALQQLDHLVRHYFDTTRDPLKHPEEMLRAGTVYMWDGRSPLQKFMYLSTQKDSTAGFFKRWALMGPVYEQYGAYLIRQYPDAYFKFYLLQNALKFYAPPGEFLFQYNMGRDTVAEVAQTWFKYKSQKVAPAVGGYEINLLNFMPATAAIVNTLFLLGYLGLLLITGFHRKSIQQKTLLLAAALWVINFAFSVFASPVTLRYQLFPILTFTLIVLLLLDKLHYLSFAKTQ